MTSKKNTVFELAPNSIQFNKSKSKQPPKTDESSVAGTIPSLPSPATAENINAYISTSNQRAREMLLAFVTAREQCNKNLDAYNTVINKSTIYLDGQREDVEFANDLKLSGVELIFLEETKNMIDAYIAATRKNELFWTSIPAASLSNTVNASLATLLYWNLVYFIFMIMGMYNRLNTATADPHDFFSKLININARSTTGTEIIGILDLDNVHNVAVDLGLNVVFTNGVDIHQLSGACKGMLYYIFSNTEGVDGVYKSYANAVTQITYTLYEYLESASITDAQIREQLTVILPFMRDASTTIYAYIENTHAISIRNAKVTIATFGMLPRSINNMYFYSSFACSFLTGLINTFKFEFPFKGQYIYNIDTPYDHYMALYQLSTVIHDKEFQLPPEFGIYKPYVINFISAGYVSKIIRVCKSVLYTGNPVLRDILPMPIVLVNPIQANSYKTYILNTMFVKNAVKQLTYMLSNIIKLMDYEITQFQAELSRIFSISYSTTFTDQYVLNINIFLRVLKRRLETLLVPLTATLTIIENFNKLTLFQVVDNADTMVVGQGIDALEKTKAKYAVLHSNIYALLYEYLHTYYIRDLNYKDVLNKIVFCYRGHYKEYPIFINADLIKSILYNGGFIPYSWCLADISKLPKEHHFIISSFGHSITKTRDIYGEKKYILTYANDKEAYVNFFVGATTYLPVIDNKLPTNDSQSKQIFNILFGSESRINLYNTMNSYGINMTDMNHEVLIKALKMHLFVINSVSRLTVISIVNDGKMVFTYSTTNLGNVIKKSIASLDTKVDLLNNTIVDFFKLVKGVEEDTRMENVYCSIHGLVSLLLFKKQNMNKSTRVGVVGDALHELLNDTVYVLEDLEHEIAHLKEAFKIKMPTLKTDIRVNINSLYLLNADTCLTFVYYIYTTTQSLFNMLYSENVRLGSSEESSFVEESGLNINIMNMYNQHISDKQYLYSLIYIKYNVYKNAANLIDTWKHVNVLQLLRMMKSNNAGNNIMATIDYNMYSDLSESILKSNNVLNGGSYESFLDGLDDYIFTTTKSTFSKFILFLKECDTVSIRSLDAIRVLITPPVGFAVVNPLHPNINVMLNSIAQVINLCQGAIIYFENLDLPNNLDAVSDISWKALVQGCDEFMLQFKNMSELIVLGIYNSDVNVYESLNVYFDGNNFENAEYLKKSCTNEFLALFEVSMFMFTSIDNIDMFNLFEVVCPVLKIPEMKVFFNTEKTGNLFYNTITPDVVQIINGVYQNNFFIEKDVEYVNKDILYKSKTNAEIPLAIIFRRRDEILDEIATTDITALNLNIERTPPCILSNLYKYCISLSTDHEFKMLASSGIFSDIIKTMKMYNNALLNNVYKCYYGARSVCPSEITPAVKVYPNIMVEVLPYEYTENADKLKLVYVIDYMSEYTNRIINDMNVVLTKNSTNPDFRKMLIRVLSVAKKTCVSLSAADASVTKRVLDINWDFKYAFNKYVSVVSNQEANVMILMLYLIVWFHMEDFKGFEEESSLAHLHLDELQSNFYLPALVRDIYNHKITAELNRHTL